MGKDLIASIKEKQALVAKLQAELDEARALLDGRSEKVDPPVKRGISNRTQRKPRPPSGGVQEGGLVIKPKSSVGRAQRILQKGGHPLPIDDLLSQVNKGRKRVKRATLIGNLSRYVKMGVVFCRTAPNTFGLLEWERKTGQGEAA